MPSGRSTSGSGATSRPAARRRRPARIALDTSAWSHFRRGDQEVLEWIGAAETVVMPATVLGELEAAFLLGGRYQENANALAEFLREEFVVTASVTPEVASRYGHLFAQLRRAGTPLATNDLWIAAAALEAGAHLITFDRDFARIPGLLHTVLGA